MTTLDACTSFCAALGSAIGPTLTDVVLVGAASGLVWWRNRKHVAAVVAPLVARADAAEKSAHDAQLQLADLKGSLRPLAYAPGTGPSLAPPLPTVGTSTPTNASGDYESVVMPELDPKLPRPSALPNFGKPK